MAYSVPNNVAANYPLEILAAGNRQLPISSGTRIAQLAIWSEALSKADLDTLYADPAVSGRFGL